MTYDDLIYGFQSKALSLGYFEQFIYGYDDRLNTGRTKDPDEDPNNFPILLIPPQSSNLSRDKVERFTPFSISGHKRARQQKSVELTIASDVVTFETEIFEAGDFVIFRDDRTNYEIPVKISTVVTGTATATSYISLTDGTITSTVEEDRAAIHARLEKEMKAVLNAVGGGFTDKTGTTVTPQAMVGAPIQIFRLDQYGTRGYVRLVMEFQVDIKNCAV